MYKIQKNLYGCLCFITLILAINAKASCGLSGIYLITKSSVLNRNGTIILVFYNHSQENVKELNGKYPVYLQSKNEKVPLMVIDTLRGEFREMEVMLKPIANLKENEIYELHIDSLTERLQRFNLKLEKWEPITFTINSTIDKRKPKFINKPVLTGKSAQGYGCGPEKWVYFKVSVKDQSETFVKAWVRNVATNITTVYLLPIKDGIVKVGHDMCSGAFHFDDSDNFEVVFSLIDQSGNLSKKTKPISFDRPVVKPFPVTQDCPPTGKYL